MYPAACPGVIGVAASDGAGAPMPWSNHGTFIDVCMDGNEIVSDYFTGWVRFDDGTSDRFSGSTVWSGTSFAAPKLAGRIAAVMTRQPARHRSARVAMQQLYTSALPVFTVTGRAGGPLLRPLGEGLGGWVGPPAMSTPAGWLIRPPIQGAASSARALGRGRDVHRVVAMRSGMARSRKNCAAFGDTKAIGTLAKGHGDGRPAGPGRGRRHPVDQRSVLGVEGDPDTDQRTETDDGPVQGHRVGLVPIAAQQIRRIRDEGHQAEVEDVHPEQRGVHSQRASTGGGGRSRTRR